MKKLNAHDMNELETAIRNGYCSVRGQRYVVRERFFWTCAKQNKPYAVVTRRRMFAAVELDLIEQRFRLSTLGVDAVWQVLDAATPARFRSRWALRAGDVFSFSNFVPSEQAEETARRLVEIASNPVHQEPQYVRRTGG